MELIASSKQVERKTLRPTIVDLKERLVDRDIHSYSWLPTQDMLADVLTKEMHLPQALENVFLKNEFSLSQPLVNEVKAVRTEISMYSFADDLTYICACKSRKELRREVYLISKIVLTFGPQDLN